MQHFGKVLRKKGPILNILEFYNTVNNVLIQCYYEHLLCVKYTTINNFEIHFQKMH